uniref:DUF4371 domain-containing protein n=1 Tax=Stegastes partitus TaxID=144197 RepID=A0A3B5BCP2_9TELE
MLNAGFAVHTKSDRHKQVMTAWMDYQKAEHNKQVQENRDYFKAAVEVLLLTATQNIAQRGNESADSDNKGNFRAILETIANHDNVVKKRLTSINNAKYTSKVIQNEVLSCLADMDSEVIGILADETKDEKGKEQMSLVLRYYFSGAVHESVLHFESSDRLDAAGLTDKITHILESHGLQYRDNLVGQACDGASIMSGKHSGVQACIKEQAKYAFYIHCSAHCLHLVLVDTVKAVPEAEQFFSLLERLASETQDRLRAIKQVLQEVAQESSGNRSVEAQGLLAQLDLQFIVYLFTFCKVFGEAKFLSDMLQSPSLDFLKAVDLVMALIQTFIDSIAESFFDNLWDEVLNIGEQCATAVQPKNAKKIHDGMQRPSNVVELTWFIESDKEVFLSSSNCKIAVSILVSTASCEQSFSTLTLVKTYLRSTMADDRLSNLGVLSTESRRAKSLNLDAFVDLFARNHKNRRIPLTQQTKVQQK